MKKALRNIVLLFLLIVPFIVKAEDKELVKVYIFEAGGCPYCEKEIEYLEGLESYNKKFTIERKELYVDHINWAKGSDYQLGYTVATAFNQAGFEDASYEGTPFVVISDLYAAASYSTALEPIIEQAYEAGDKDVVGCFASGKEDCLEGVVINNKTKETSPVAIGIIVGIIIVGAAGLIYIISKSDN